MPRLSIPILTDDPAPEPAPPGGLTAARITHRTCER
jgi:hypothetical protein